MLYVFYCLNMPEVMRGVSGERKMNCKILLKVNTSENPTGDEQDSFEKKIGLKKKKISHVKTCKVFLNLFKYREC